MATIPSQGSPSRPLPWLVGLCSVIFDVDLGQRVEHLVPAGVLSEEEKRDVAFHAFPDSMSHELHARTSIKDSSFFFRVKRRGEVPSSNNKEGSTTRPSCSPRANTVDDSASSPDVFLYGFAFCRQRQDESLRRGGEQLSVVVLAEHPFSNVYKPLSQVAGPMFFSGGLAALEQVHEEVNQWPPPVPETLLQLQIGYSTISVRLPKFMTLPMPSTESLAEQGAQPQNWVRLLLELIVRTVQEKESVSPPVQTPTRNTSAAISSRDSSAHGAAAAAAAIIAGGTFPSSAAWGATSPTSGAAAAAAGGTSPTSTTAAAAAAGVSSPSSGGGGGAGAGGGGVQSSQDASAYGGLRLLGLKHAKTSPLDLEGAMTAAQIGSYLPRRSSVGYDTLKASGSMHGAFYEVDVYSPLQGQLQRLWHLWELILLGRPILVVGLSPMVCSQATAALISLIAPLPYSQDFRPYFTIQDPAFASLASGRLPSHSIPDSLPAAATGAAASKEEEEANTDLPCLVGVTNLFFVKALSQWPNILSVGRKEQAGNSWEVPGTIAATAVAMLFPGNAVKALRQRSQGAQSLLSGGHSETLWSGYRPVTRPDNNLLSRLLKPKPSDIKSKLSRIAFVNSDAIRRHFFDLTTALLLPFDRYFEIRSDGKLPQWNPEEFLFSVRSSVPSPVLLDRLSNIGNVVELFARFISSRNFHNWFELRRTPLRHLVEEPKSVGLVWFSEAKQHVKEVELVAMFFGVGKMCHHHHQQQQHPVTVPHARTAVGFDWFIGLDWFSEAKQHVEEVELVAMFFGVGKMCHHHHHQQQQQQHPVTVRMLVPQLALTGSVRPSIGLDWFSEAKQHVEEVELVAMFFGVGKMCHHHHHHQQQQQHPVTVRMLVPQLALTGSVRPSIGLVWFSEAKQHVKEVELVAMFFGVGKMCHHHHQQQQHPVTVPHARTAVGFDWFIGLDWFSEAKQHVEEVELVAMFFGVGKMCHHHHQQQQQQQHPVTVRMLVPQLALTGSVRPSIGLDWFSEAKQHVEEVELVGMFFGVEQQLEELAAEDSSADASLETKATVDRLNRELVTIFMGMQTKATVDRLNRELVAIFMGMQGKEDLQFCCISSPARRARLLSLNLSEEQRALIIKLTKDLGGPGN
eukprot:gene22159-29224_t